MHASSEVLCSQKYPSRWRDWIFAAGHGLTFIVCCQLSSKLSVFPHDGYHLPMDQLRQYPDAADMIYRRGAPDTFDPVALQRDLDRIRNDSYTEGNALVYVPGFEHEKGDPEPDKHIFDRQHHKVVIAEGLVCCGKPKKNAIVSGNFGIVFSLCRIASQFQFVF